MRQAAKPPMVSIVNAFRSSENRLRSFVRRLVTNDSDIDDICQETVLRALEFHGLFRTGDTETLFLALKASFGIDARYIDANTVALHRGAQPEYSEPTADNQVFSARH